MEKEATGEPAKPQLTKKTTTTTVPKVAPFKLASIECRRATLGGGGGAGSSRINEFSKAGTGSAARLMTQLFVAKTNSGDAPIGAPVALTYPLSRVNLSARVWPGGPIMDSENDHDPPRPQKKNRINILPPERGELELGNLSSEKSIAPDPLPPFRSGCG